MQTIHVSKHYLALALASEGVCGALRVPGVVRVQQEAPRGLFLFLKTLDFFMMSGVSRRALNVRQGIKDDNLTLRWERQ